MEAFCSNGQAVALIDDFNAPDALQAWRFSNGPEFPGATGALGPARHGASGAAALRFRFPCDVQAQCGHYVAAYKRLAVPLAPPAEGAAFYGRVKLMPQTGFALRLVDESGQTLQYTVLPLSMEDDSFAHWHEAVVPLDAASTVHWGGANNGRINGRIVEIGVLAENAGNRALEGEIVFDDLKLIDTRSAAAALPTPGSRAATLDRRILPPPRFGVAVHFTADNHALDLAQDAGFSFVRTDLAWSRVEKNGRYDFSAYDALMSELDARGMGALWILDYGHPDHGGGAPRLPADRQAFVRYVLAAIAHFKGHRVQYEIWNEPNLGKYWKPVANPQEYAALLRETLAAIRESDPAAHVSTGGVSQIDLPYLQQVLETGSANQASAVGVHPYRQSAPETAAQEIASLRHLVSSVTGRHLPIWSTEWGYSGFGFFPESSYGDGHAGTAQQRQAVLAVRELLTAWGLQLPMAVWYDLIDDGADASDVEANFGLLTLDHRPKPALDAIRNLHRQISGRRPTGLLAGLPAGVHGLRFEGADDTLAVIWNDQPQTKPRLVVPSQGFVSAADLSGRPVNAVVTPPSLVFTLDEARGPVYVRQQRARSPSAWAR